MWFKILEALAIVAICTASSLKCMQVFQAKRYQLRAYSRWVSENTSRNLRTYLFISVVTVAVDWYLPILMALFIQVEQTRTALAGWIVLCGFGAVAGLRAWREISDLRQSFVMTSRAQRLLITHIGVYMVLAAILLAVRLPVFLMYAGIPYISKIPQRIMKPLEDKINKNFYREARQKLMRRSANGSLICVGITGSCGKTTTKFILKALLEKKYDVLMTPGSHNTLMGVSKTINDLLENHHQVFLAEMGALYRDDIRQLTTLVRPKYGVITSIAPEHVETLGSMEKVMSTKEKLVKGLPEDGEAFFGSDSMFMDRLFDRCEHTKFRASLDPAKEAYMTAENIVCNEDGTSFILRCTDGGRVYCHTELLGRFNIQDIALAACVAFRMGVSLHDIADGISNLKAIPHHLEAVSGKKCGWIDDTANRTLAGAADALNVLMSLNRGKRVLVTGGLDVPQNRSEDVDYEYGSMMRDCVDVLILVGDREDLNVIARAATEKRDGSKGISRKQVVFLSNAQAANEYIQKNTVENDCVLLEGYLEEW